MTLNFFNNSLASIGRSRSVVEGGIELIQVDGLYQHGQRAGAGDLPGRAGNEDDTSIGMLRHDVTARRQAVESWHLVIHEHDIRLVPLVSMDGLQARANHLNNLVPAKANEFRQRRSHTFLVVSNQHAHMQFSQARMPIDAFFLNLQEEIGWKQISRVP